MVFKDGPESKSPISVSPDPHSDSEWSPELKRKFFWQIENQQTIPQQQVTSNETELISSIFFLLQFVFLLRYFL